ncbi:MAG TPA: GTPase [Pyrodictium sp.]|nr:GTPase [Pyrodictium sp.]
MYFIVFVGPAGSGKSHLVDAFGDWLEFNELSVARVNLDPAAEWLPYEPDIDVREYVDARKVMEKYKLGPNGALVASIDMLVSHVDDIRSEIESIRANYVLIDTPGQMELFAFRESGPQILRMMLGDFRSVAVFLIDAVFASNPASLASSVFLAFSTRLRLSLPQVMVISKSDLLPQKKMEEIDAMLNDPALFYDKLVGSGVDPLFAESVVKAMESLLPPEASDSPQATRFVSAVSGYGLEDLYAVVQQILAGGEDFYTEEPNPRL